MVDTGIHAELQNCIRQAQDQLTKMGPIIAKVSAQEPEAKELEKMNAKAGRLLRKPRSDVKSLCNRQNYYRTYRMRLIRPHLYLS